MRRRDFADYINDIIESCQDILVFTKGFSPEKFIKDKKTMNAVIRSLKEIFPNSMEANGWNER